MSFIYKKIIEHNDKQAIVVHRDFKAASRSVAEAEKFLRKWPNVKADRFDQCNLKELKVWRDVLKSKRSLKHLLPTLDALIAQKQHEATRASKQTVKKAQADKKFQPFIGLSARDLIAEAEELQEREVELLIEWERNNKNRASVLKALNQLVSDTGSPNDSAPQTTKKAHGPNPFKAENEKIYKKGLGTVREMCQDCGEINTIDVSLLAQVAHRRSNSTRGRMDAWADRQIEGGSRMTGRHAAAEASRANQNNIANKVSSGFPCAFCGSPLLR